MLAAVLLFGCSKYDSPQKPRPATHTHAPSSPQKRDGNDDDDDPIIMEMTLDAAGNPLNGSLVTLINGTDTISGTTAQNGSCPLSLPRTGTWDLNVTHTGYITSARKINVTDSFTVHIDTLTPPVSGY